MASQLHALSDSLHVTSLQSASSPPTPPRSRAFPTTREVQQFVFQHGNQYDSYLATEPEHQLFWSSNNGGVISFGQWSRHLLVRGGLIAREDEKRRLLTEFCDHVEPLRLTSSFFGVHEADLHYFREAGYRISKLGEDALIDLGNVTFAGKKFEWVRRQVNYCRRHGLVIEEVGPDLQTPQQWEVTLQEALGVCQDALSKRPQAQELTFFDGRIGRHPLGHRRMFVARSDHGRGRMEGFVVCNPMQGGRAWSTEIYRHRTDGVRGTVPFLFHHLILKFQDEGSEQVNLCLVPARNCEVPVPGDNPLIRHGLAVAQNYFRPVFNLAGIDHFKSRFRPRYESRYVCAPQQQYPGAFVATLVMFGVLRIDVRKACRLFWNGCRRRLPGGRPGTGE